MPHSLVLNLLPASAIPPGFTAGKQLHALFLNLVSSVDAEMGNQLHANQGNKAFTLSPLQVVQNDQFSLRSKRDRPIQKAKPNTPKSPLLNWHHTYPIPPNTPCWWRISLLDDRLFSRLNQLWLNLNPDHPWHLGPANLHITSILGTPQSTQPWANFCNYEQLYQQASAQERKLTLQFYTPTAFRQSQYDSALPTPDRVFGSLLRRWNHYSPLEFTADSLETLRPSCFDIHTEVVRDPRSQFQQTGAITNPCNQFVGCVGKVTYRILGEVETTVVKQLNTLADFALYAGVGRKTPMGMGICRRVEF
ncbi:CRISPR-associated endoribonuclease Cas6 [Almyronema epifaneia]|uniref:CRISPR-associated endoribonuclease Cas6 n=1 Tax=Almyronema epifaneia S1 TaxID=2991925 RepID=A0ABW6ICX0_9CYAN